MPFRDSSFGRRTGAPSGSALMSFRAICSATWRALRTESRYDLLAVFLVTLIGLALRVDYLGQPIRYDEAFTYLTYASRPLSDIVAAYSSPNNHLLNTVLVHFSTMAWGGTPWAIRLPALVAGILMIPASWFAARMLFGRATALVTAALVASSSSLVELSTNGRGYTMVGVAFLLLVGLSRVRLPSARGATNVLMVVAGALGFYAIPTMLFPFGAVVVWLLLEAACARDVTLRRALIARACWLGIGVAGLTALLYAPVIMKSGLGAITSNGYVEGLPWTYFARDVGHSVRALWANWNRDLPPFVVVGFGLCALAGFVVHRRTAPEATFLVVGLVATIIPIVLIRRVVPYTRVWTFLIPIYAMFVAEGAVALGRRVLRGKAPPRWASLPAVSVLLAMSLSAAVIRGDGVLTSPDTGAFPQARSVARILAHRLHGSDALIAEAPANYPVLYELHRLGVTPAYARTIGNIPRWASRWFFVSADTLETQRMIDMMPFALGSPSESIVLGAPIATFDSVHVYLIDPRRNLRSDTPHP